MKVRGILDYFEKRGGRELLEAAWQRLDADENAYQKLHEEAQELHYMAIALLELVPRATAAERRVELPAYEGVADATSLTDWAERLARHSA